MQEPESETSSGADTGLRILGFRIAVGLVGLVLLILSFMLGMCGDEAIRHQPGA